MKTNLKIWLIALFLGFTSTTSAQSPLEDLFRLEGSWQGEATLVLEGNTFNFTYYMNFEKNSESSGMNMEEWFTHPDLGTLRGYNLIGYNSRDGKIHWFSVDNFGTCHDHQGYWKSSSHFYMETTEKHGGKKFEEKIDIIFLDPDRVSMHLVASLGGLVFEDISGIFQRQAGGPISNKIIPQVEMIEKADCQIYPNPAHQYVTVKIGAELEKNVMKLSVIDASGVFLKEMTVKSGNNVISLAGMTPGVYIFRIFSKTELLYSKKLVIQ